MSRQRWQRVKRLFQQAMALEGDARQEFLDRLGGEAPAERREVESLLAAHAEAEGFLDRPPSQIAAGALAEAESPGALASQDSEAGAPSLEGQRIGPYRIVRRIGRGGLGSVYLATREEEFQKQVAIKLIRRAVVSGELMRRFEIERQILANVDHPCIARLLDGGTTEDGLPYLVMEYIEGDPIDRYCDQNRLSVRRRLALFTEVCEAVGAAHRSLVVHCDIKPDNVLVTHEGVPKLLDFGVARLLGREAAPDSEDPRWGAARILTPDYASPEQLRGGPVTTASDVYSLGVLLYELLTGSRPHSVGELPLDEAARLVSTSVPRRPSTVPEGAERGPAAGLGEDRVALERAAGERSTTPARLQRQLAGDLDSIVLKALRTEPERRYASVEQLASDAERHLRGFPVSARGAGVAYRAARFVGRHRLVVAAVVLALTTILGFLGVLAVQSVRLAKARDRAEAEAASARTVSGFLQEMLTKADPFKGIGGEATVLQALDLAVSEIDVSFKRQPALEATVRDTAGLTYLQLGRYAEAEPQLTRSLEIRRRLQPAGRLDLARSLTSVGRLRHALGAYEVAEGHYRQALQIARAVATPELPLTAEIIARLAVVRHDRGDIGDAEMLYREALGMRRSLLGSDHPQVASSLDDLGNLLQEVGELETAEGLFREALAIRRRQLEAEHPDISESLNNLASVLHDQDRLDQADDLYRESLRMARQRLGDDHPEVAVAINNLATLLHDRDALEEAEALYRQALAMSRRIYGAKHPQVAISLGNLADLLHDRGDLAAAERLRRQSVEMDREFLGDAHPRLAAGLESLSVVLEERGELAAAEATLTAALEVYRRAFGDEDPDVALTLADLGSVVCLRGEPSRASDLFEQAIAMLERLAEDDEELIAEIRDEAEACLRSTDPA